MTTFGTAAPACHTGPKKVFSTPTGVEVWAGGQREIEPLVHVPWTLRIRIDDGRFGFPNDNAVNLRNGAEAMFPNGVLLVASPPTIDITWGDFEVPIMGREWWQALANGISSLPKGSGVVVYCQGGHGRTGTAISILAALTGAIPDGDPVVPLRKIYCHKMVETDKQIEYIEAITGRVVDAKGSYDWSFSYTSAGPSPGENDAALINTGSTSGLEDGLEWENEDWEWTDADSGDIYVRQADGVWRLKTNAQHEVVGVEKVTDIRSTKTCAVVEQSGIIKMHALDPAVDARAQARLASHDLAWLAVQKEKAGEKLTKRQRRALRKAREKEKLANLDPSPNA